MIETRNPPSRNVVCLAISRLPYLACHTSSQPQRARYHLSYALFVLLRWVIQWDTLCQIVVFTNSTAYFAEDVFPLGPLSSHLFLLFVLAVRRDDAVHPLKE